MRRLPAAAALLSLVALGAASTHAGAAPLPGPLSFATTALAGGGGEPNVAISPSGSTVLVDGLGNSPATFYRSTDGGVTYTKITPAFSKKGGGDWDMRFLDETHVVAADLSLGSGIYVHRSADAGLTWTTTQLNQDVYDRPWLDHDGNTVFLVAKGFDGIPYLYTSTDGGATFGNPPVPVIVYGAGADPLLAEAAAGNNNSYIDHITVDPRTHDVYVLFGIGGADSFGPSAPAGKANRLYVAHLEKNLAGQPAFVDRPVYKGSGTEAFISGFNWSTVDQAGTLYVLGNGVSAGHHSTRLTYSKDHGVTWSPLVDLGAPGAANVYGSIAGGAPGVLSLVSLRGSNENPSSAQNWYAEMARVSGADTATPSIERTRPMDKPIHTKDICFDGILCGLPGFGDDRTLLDYVWNAVAPDGTAFAVIASDGPAAPASGGNPSVVVLRQTGGASHGPGVQS